MGHRLGLSVYKAHSKMKQTFELTIRIIYACFLGSIFTFAYYGWDQLLWLSFAIHFTISTFSSVATHRYYCHNAFKANDNLMFFMVWVTTLYFYPSTVSFNINHTAHHTLSDTPEDTHVRGWRGFFIKNHKDAPVKFLRVGLKLLRIHKHKWLHDNFVLLTFGIWAITALISFKVFLFVFIVPTFTFHLAGRLSVNFGHYKGRPVNRWYMEYIIPFGGEWAHAHHHDKPHDFRFGQRWYEFDPGALLIRLIRHDNV